VVRVIVLRALGVAPGVELGVDARLAAVESAVRRRRTPAIRGGAGHLHRESASRRAFFGRGRRGRRALSQLGSDLDCFGRIREHVDRANEALRVVGRLEVLRASVADEVALCASLYLCGSVVVYRVLQLGS